MKLIRTTIHILLVFACDMKTTKDLVLSSNVIRLEIIELNANG